jgi:hypothetical protein
MIHTLTHKESQTQSQVALHLMVNQLTQKKRATTSSDNVIHNDIPAEMFVDADQHKLAAVLGMLLNTIHIHNKNSTIRITAKKYHNVILLHMKSDSKFNSPVFAGVLTDVEQIARNIGGTVGVTSYRNNITTVVLSFINAKLAA